MKNILKKSHILTVIFIIIMVLCLLSGCDKKSKLYNEAIGFMDDGNYQAAIDIFENLGDYKNAPDLIKKAQNKKTVQLFEKLKDNEQEVKKFKPEYPDPEYYIICVNPIIDPVTKKESEGGYNFQYARQNPIDSNYVRMNSIYKYDSFLGETKDPNFATYALIITFAYNHTGIFTFADDSTIIQYHGTTKAELYNMITGESIYTNEKKTYATFAGESVQTSMLDAAKGKQMYAHSSVIGKRDFENFDEFIKNNEIIK